MPDAVSHWIARHLTATNLAAIGLLWATVILAGVVTYRRAYPGSWSVRGLIRHIAPAEVLRHPSARADFLFWLSRRIFMPLFVVPLIISTVAAGHFAFWLLTLIFGAPAHAPGPAGPWTLVGFTVTMLIAYDLSYYLYHRLQHQVPILWELHKVHHSAEVMVGVTKDRVHPIDEIMNRWWDGLIPGLCYGIWMFYALDPVEVTVFGLNVYVMRNTILMMDFIRHTNMKLSYGRVGNAGIGTGISD
jgi:sterol desaturase/sphingolipid hydroxylase (fatty acid hydroxylase superfamily)